MAAPAQKTLKDLNGQWVMVRPPLPSQPSKVNTANRSQNKSLSDDFDTILALVRLP